MEINVKVLVIAFAHLSELCVSGRENKVMEQMHLDLAI